MEKLRKKWNICDHFLNSDHKFYERDKIRGKFQENE